MSLNPAKQNFEIWAGGTFRKKMTLLIGPAGSTPRDLTGYTANLAIRDKPRSTNILVTLSSTGVSPAIILGGTLGTINIVIPDTETAAYTWRVGVYDLLIKAPGASGESTPLLYGHFKIRGI